MGELFGADLGEPQASEPLELEPMEPESLEPAALEPEITPPAGSDALSFDSGAWGQAAIPPPVPVPEEPASLDISMDETPLELTSEPPPPHATPIEEPLGAEPAPAWDTPTSPGGAWDSLETSPPAPEAEAQPLDLEPEPPPAEPFEPRGATLAEMAQETVTQPPPLDSPEDELPPVEIDAEDMEATSSQERPRLAPMHEFIPAAESFGEPPASASPPDIQVDPSAIREAVERLAREMIAELAREVLEKVAWDVVPAMAETILKEEIEKLVQEKLR
jgi:hypothetical protein